MNEIYVSVDIEADGPIPGDNSMLSIGSAAYDESESLLSTFSANILPLQAGQQNPITMDFGASNPKHGRSYKKTGRHLAGSCTGTPNGLQVCALIPIQHSSL